MKTMLLKAFSVAKELDLNKMAALIGIPKKYTWEEPLTLKGASIEDLIGAKTSSDQKVYLFSFGSAVFINLNGDEIRKIVKFLYKNLSGIEIENYDDYSDDYEVKILDKGDESKEEHQYLTNEYITLYEYKDIFSEIIADVIAKSVALERAEANMEAIMDSIEYAIVKIEKIKLMMRYRTVAKIVSKVVRHQYNTISYIMILDKHDLTWTDSEASTIYDDLSKVFELKDRFEILSKKTEIINSIIDNLSSISNSVRANFVEWVIVVLILFELIITLLEKIFKI